VARRLVPLLAACLLLGACGGGDDGAEVKDTVRDFVKATNARDGDRLCNDLVTQDYLEKATGATGDQAGEACKQQLDLITGLKLRLISIGEPKVDGDSATVRATIAIGSQRTPRRFVLHKEDGNWKLASGS
jgi:ketosteroid isomerase-like protein